MYETDKGLMVKVYRSGEWGAKGPNGYTVIGVVKDWDAYKARTFEPIPENSRVFSPTEDRPAAILALSNLGGGPPRLIPLETYLSGKWVMAGGDLVDFSDGRWGELVSSFQPKAKEVGLHLASSVDVHDRVEN